MNFEFINISFAYIHILLDFCCFWTGSIFLGIFLFTVITKILLLPVSFWCQKNSLIMVQLLPEINRIKTNYFGDSEMIADEERKLFKQKNYHPLLSLLPLAVQIFLLLTLFSAIEKQLANSAGCFAIQIPVKDGGYSYLMPVFSGIAAAIFGWTQNYQNPLQKEQTIVQQMLTNALTILISLLLGFFVPVGVCFYWAASNLLSIGVQWICNLVMPPRKYIDYYRLRKSQLQYQKLLSTRKKESSPEVRKRGKEDFKRFFSIANKHLVFYSEGSGFYKYFEQLIDYLLLHSNITIHYVTSDPDDQIFEISKKKKRIRPYYIGDMKLISLFMRMDADIVVMTTPDLGNFHLKRSYVKKDIEYIYIDHAISSTHMTYREHAFDHFDTFFCVCQNQVDELRCMEKLYKTKAKNLVHFGYPLLDTLLQRYAMQNNKTASSNPPKIMIAPSWQEGNIFDGIYKTVLESLSGHGFSITLRAHPEYMKRFPEKWEAVQNFCKSRNFSDVEIERDFSSNDTIFNSDLVITDWSGIAYEFAFSVLRPVLFINTPMKIINSNYQKLNMEPINITMRSAIGVNLDLSKLNSILKAVTELLNEPEKYKKHILAARKKYVFNVGCSGAAGGQYILTALVKKQTEKRCNPGK